MPVLNNLVNPCSNFLAENFYCTLNLYKLLFDKQAIETEQKHSSPIVVEVLPLNNLFAAEEYHQNIWTKSYRLLPGRLASAGLEPRDQIQPRGRPDQTRPGRTPTSPDSAAMRGTASA